MYTFKKNLFNHHSILRLAVSLCYLSILTLRENGRNNSQQCWANNGGSCCVRLHVA